MSAIAGSEITSNSLDAFNALLNAIQVVLLAFIGAYFRGK